MRKQKTKHGKIIKSYNKTIKSKCEYLFPFFFSKASEMEHTATGIRDEPQTDFIYCCGANTELLKFGATQLKPAHKTLVLVIPGELD